MDIKIKITNLRQIRDAFNRSPRIMTKNLHKAILRSVIQIGRESRKNTPVLTGRLRASHYERFSGTLRGEVGTNTTYDTFVHEGTRFMRGRPYLRMAVEGQQGFVNKEFEDAVKNTLDEIGRAV